LAPARSHQYCVFSGASQDKTDMDILEIVQQKAIKIIRSRSMTYSERTGFFSLKNSRARGGS